ncbi:MAG: LLM class flavin-dependent oxidoreductase [Minwuia sp.]|uniref:LLM class flavin-dependent oxidoreductase n=1 Tax=Minwuia sp. TaxID=2493630 RepID=UPI003A85FAFD
MRLSVLDQSPIRSGATPADAIAESIELARACDRLGYHRYWLAEHHASGGLAGAAPEILIGHIAQATQNIRVGSGGVMLSHYSALKVAETFRMLETLHPGRIDLGVGRAPGSDQKTMQALRAGPGSASIDYYPRQVLDTIGFMENRLEDDHPFRGIIAQPAGETVPEVWMLGSSMDSAAYAAHFGLPFSFAHFITPRGGDMVAEAYRQRFRPSERYPEPRLSVGVFALAADTEEKAEYLVKSRNLWLVRLMKGELGPFPTPEEADAYTYGPHDLEMLEANRGRSIAGTPDKVARQLSELRDTYQADELVVVTISHDFEARVRSYELLAREFGLQAKAAA